MKNQREKIYQVELRNKAKKNLLKIPSSWQTKIVLALGFLEYSPFCGEKMKGEFAGHRKIRIGAYRIVYEILEKKVYVKRINHRQGVYK